MVIGYRAFDTAREDFLLADMLQEDNGKILRQEGQ